MTCLPKFWILPFLVQAPKAEVEFRSLPISVPSIVRPTRESTRQAFGIWVKGFPSPAADLDGCCWALKDLAVGVVRYLNCRQFSILALTNPSRLLKSGAGLLLARCWH